MKKVTYLLIIFSAGIFQASLLNLFRVFNVKPDLLLISAIFAAFIFDLRSALALGAICGLLKDSLSANTLGINTALFGLWVFLIIRLSREIPLDNNLIRAAVVFVVVIFQNIISRVIFFALGSHLSSLGVFIRAMILELIYASAILALIFYIIKSTAYPLETE
ncbi:MAG: rod shape-determining protein MreD [Candidatus Omnitrophica bacterium]|nr:rod shape-determining protein MreD [Candidatus Omnitrophota bacterium]